MLSEALGLALGAGGTGWQVGWGEGEEDGIAGLVGGEAGVCWPGCGVLEAGEEG